MEETKFWMVYNPAGSTPRFRHRSRLAAEKEAARLASLNPGDPFFVLKCVGGFACKISSPEPIRLVRPEGGADSSEARAEEVPF